jgi:hypothetical protein
MKRVEGFAIAAVLAFVTQTHVLAADSFDFETYRVPDIYRSKPQLPDFKGRDKDFALFKTRIVDAMKKGVTFAGQYSTVQFGCGTGCSQVVVANNRTGQLYDFPRGGENNQALTLEYTVDSNLMLARWYTDSLWETCIIESFVLDGGRWIAKEALAGKGGEICEGGIAGGAVKARSF